MRWYEKSFIYATYVIYVLYFIVFFGLWNNAPSYLYTLNYWRQIFMGILLVYYFHPFKKTKFTEFHRKIVFASGLFLLGTSTLHEIIHLVKSTLEPIPRQFLNYSRRALNV